MKSHMKTFGCQHSALSSHLSGGFLPRVWTVWPASLRLSVASVPKENLLDTEFFLDFYFSYHKLIINKQWVAQYTDKVSHSRVLLCSLDSVLLHLCNLFDLLISLWLGSFSFPSEIISKPQHWNWSSITCSQITLIPSACLPWTLKMYGAYSPCFFFRNPRTSWM